MGRITDRLMAVRHRIDATAEECGRDPESIELIAVSKTFPTNAIEEAMHAGQKAFGENYVQEGVEKIKRLDTLRPWLEWHFIGPLQSNKTGEIAEHFDWIHTIDRLKIAQRLSDQRGAYARLGPLQVCIQINISQETSKSGIQADQALELCEQISTLPNLVLRGFMAIPAPNKDHAKQRATFAALRELFESIRSQKQWDAGFGDFDTLSMGMSDDLEAAIAEGATMVRVGSAIFGERQLDAKIES
jgi:pyridoxal phosphate enzyme (YggS family)